MDADSCRMAGIGNPALPARIGGIVGIYLMQAGAINEIFLCFLTGSQPYRHWPL